LLSLIANEINKNGFSIANAKINTLGGRAEDFFLLTHMKKTSPANLKNLETSIKDQLLINAKQPT
jgi:UTP:GlnB (protein PII) uridylyltransferase